MSPTYMIGSSMRCNDNEWESEDSEPHKDWARSREWPARLSEWRNQRAQRVSSDVIGLRNIGNSCYMNSILQCLLRTDFLTEYFISGKYTDDLNRKSKHGTNGSLALGYGRFVTEVYNNSKHKQVLGRDKLKRLKDVLGKMNPEYRGTSQQDAHELFTYMIDKLHEDTNLVVNRRSFKTTETKGLEDKVIAELAWDNILRQNKSIILDNLTGLVRYKSICPNEMCKVSSVQFQQFYSISLPIPRSLSVSVVFVRLKTPKATRYILKLPFGSTGKDVADYLKGLTGVGSNSIYVCQLSSNRLYRNYYIPYSKKNDKIAWKNGLELMAYQLDESQTSTTPVVSQILQVRFSLSNKKRTYNLFRAPEMIRLLTGISNADVHTKVWEVVQWMFRSHSVEEPTELYGLYSVHNEVIPSNTQVLSVPNNIICLKLNEKGVATLRDTMPIVRVKDFNKGTRVGRNKILNLGKVIEDTSIHGSGKRLTTLLECFEEFRRPDPLLHKTCEGCQKKVEATQKTDLWDTKDILCIHLKRFSRTENGWTKLRTMIDFPLEGLDLSDHILGAENKSVYDLYAVSNHMGRLKFGHYTATVRTPEGWFLCNDSKVTKIDAESVASANAYMLFYKLR